MRDPARIDRIVALLAADWKNNPDQRLGQLIVNVLGVSGETRLFYCEDDEWERRLQDRAKDV